MNVIIVSEVARALKPETRSSPWGISIFSWILLFSFSFTGESAAAVSAANAPMTVQQLNDCNWLISYRGRIYDLAPLTRSALSRPLEDDIRSAMQRVPAASDHLNTMSKKLDEAKFHTVLASIFVSGFVVTKILRSREKNVAKHDEYDLISAATGGFFLSSTFFSWRATRDAKSHLVQAVEAFNEKSPDKMVPAAAVAPQWERRDKKESEDAKAY
jgi:hypothetical protein